MFNRSRALLVATLGTVLALGAPMLTLTPRATLPVATVSKKRKLGLFNGAPLPRGVALVGGSSLHVSVAQGKRDSAKRRNQRRFKRACRG